MTNALQLLQTKENDARNGLEYDVGHESTHGEIIPVTATAPPNSSPTTLTLTKVIVNNRNHANTNKVRDIEVSFGYLKQQH